MSSIWDFFDAGASAVVNSWRVQVEPARPDLGIQARRGTGDPWSIFAVLPQPTHRLQLSEAYAREHDLILRIRQSQDDTFAMQLHYRLLSNDLSDLAEVVSEKEDWLAIEIWLSIQTELLDASPALVVSSQCPLANSWKLVHGSQLNSEVELDQADPPVAAVSRGEQGTGIWLVDFNDEQQGELEGPPTDRRQRIRLFGHFMEKGVIRRTRMRFYVTPQPVVESQLAALIHGFQQSPLPLTD